MARRPDLAGLICLPFAGKDDWLGVLTAMVVGAQHCMVSAEEETPGGRMSDVAQVGGPTSRNC